MTATDTISGETVKEFLRRRFKKGRQIQTDGLPALNLVADEHVHEKKNIQPIEASVWLP